MYFEHQMLCLYAVRSVPRSTAESGPAPTCKTTFPSSHHSSGWFEGEPTSDAAISVSLMLQRERHEVCACVYWAVSSRRTALPMCRDPVPAWTSHGMYHSSRL